MSQSTPINLETDPRFPSGPWTGFFLQKFLPGKQRMELGLTFSQGVMTGQGRDLIGEFIVRGKYCLEDGKCHFSKRYLGKHDVFYQGYNEGKGIWGVWEISAAQNEGVRLTGGFHIWPEGLPDPATNHLATAEEVPAPVEELLGV